MLQQAHVQAFFDDHSNTFSYVIVDGETSHCAIIDSVLDYDAASVTTCTQSADQIVEYVKREQLKVQWILETHVHADHLSAAQYLKQCLGGRIAMSEKISTVQDVFSEIYHLEREELQQQMGFDYLFKDDEPFKIGQLQAYALATPGHTPACLSYVIADAVFVGDTLFMPDYGTARCDFPEGCAAQLYDSVQKLYALPETTRVFLCHDYLPEQRQDYVYETTISAQKSTNIHIHAGVSKEEFVAMRQGRDATLSMPKLILPAIQVNMQAGRFPKPEANGQRYLKLPLNFFK